MQGALRVATVAVVAAVLASCKGAPRRAPEPAPSASAAAPAVRRADFDGAPLTAIALRAVDDARAALVIVTRELGAGCASVPGYPTLREHTSTAAPFVRVWAPAAAEVLLGPARAGEGAGALATLDAALSSANCAAARDAVFQLERSLTLAKVELASARPTLERGVRVLSDANYELGLHLALASSATSASAAGALGDARGALAAVALGAKVYGDASNVDAALEPVRAALATATSLDDLDGRARLVRATGRSGAAFRALSRQSLAPRSPYPPLVSAAGPDADALSPLTLPRPRAKPRADLVDVGARLFSERKLSRDARRSCADCHRPDRAFTDGLRVPPSLDAAPIVRNTPTLLYAYLSATQRWDGRVVAPEDQALSVLHTSAEMGLSSREIEDVVRADAALGGPLAAASGSVTAAGVAAAIGAYVETLGPATAPIDRFARFEGDLSDDESAGFDVFAGKARCTRCHVPPSFAGSRPTDFQVPIFAAIGVPQREASSKIDGDEGRFGVTARAEDHHAFKTPTLRNVARTAPYFHNGSFRTLGAVIDFYDRGGGVGRGMAVANQDPDVRPLKLTTPEKRVLQVFLASALSDAPAR